MQSAADQGEHRPVRRGDVPRRRQQAERRLPQQTIAELVAGYLEGRPTTELTHQFGLGKSTVLRLLREHDVPMRNQGLPPEQVIEAARLYQSGWSLAKIAAHLGVSTKHVHDRLLTARVVMRDSHGRVRS